MADVSDVDVLVVGCGSIGQRHIRNLRALGIRRVTATDCDAASVDLATTAGAVAARSLEEGLGARPMLVVVGTPPATHVGIARQAVAAGAHVLVEKPIDVAVTPELDALLAEARVAGRTVAVGYNLRFHTALRALKGAVDERAAGDVLLLDIEFGYYLPDWRPGRDYRTGYGTQRALGGGILLDASHELDYLRWIGGEVASVFAVLARVSALDMDVEDTAFLSCRMHSGAVAHVRLDCLQRRYSRHCKVIGSDGVVEWNWESGTRIARAGGSGWDQIAAPPDVNQMYVDELRDVLQAVADGRHPLVTGEDGRATLAVLDAARESSIARAEVRL